MRGPIPEGMWGYDATAMQYNHDETKAKAEWDKVTSKPTSLTFLYSDNDPNWEPIALATQSSLNKLGINVKLENWRTPPCATEWVKVITTLRLATGARILPTRICL